MFKYTLLSSIILAQIVGSVDICVSKEVCVCRDNGKYVDCANHNGELLLPSNYTLPDIVHSVDLSSSNISRLETSKLLQSVTLLKLFINNNQIKEIRSRVFRLPELTWLELSNNQLEYIDKEVFTDINKLEYLNLANNRFVTYDQMRLHRLININELVLDNNNLGPAMERANLFDRNAFGLEHKIQALSISGVGLNVIPDNFFSSAFDLRKLVVSHNKLKDIFELPFTLEYLDLSDNPIEEISVEDFNDLLALRVLKMNNLAIKEVPEYIFDSLHSLATLELERNKNLTQFNVLAFGQKVLDSDSSFVLETLSLKESCLTRLDEQLSKPFGQLILLDLQGNPFHCDCDIAWLKTMKIAPENSEHLRCASPKSLVNAKILELDSKYFVCEKSSHYWFDFWTDHYILLSVAGLSLILIMVAVVLWYCVVVPRHQRTGDVITKADFPIATYTAMHGHRPAEL